MGAGPTGLAVAALLSDRGLPVLVLERRPTGPSLPRAVHLDDESMRVLQQVGVAADLAPLTRPGRGLRLLDARHRTMAEFARGDGPGGYPAASMFDQPDLDRLLAAHVGSRAEVRTGCEVVGLDQDATGVRLQVRRDGRIEELAADAVLGCDGAGSTVRDLIGVGLQDLGFTERWLVVDVRTDRRLGTWDGVHQVCDPARAATYLQVGPDRYRWEFRLHDGEHGADLDLDRLVAPWTGRVGLAGMTVLRRADYEFRARLADRWRDRRVLLLGDAAHQTPPFVGQGLGSGLRDAANLSWKLAAVLADGADEALLDTYEGERAPHARALVRTAVRAGWAMTGGQDRAAAVRRTALAALCRVPGLLDRGTPPLRPGPLVARRGPGGLTGRLVPQPRLRDGARLDDRLGDGFAVLTTGPLAADVMTRAARLDARVLRLGTDVVDPAGVLAGWLSGARATAVVVRPDRVVLAATDSRGRLRPGSLRALDTALALLGR